LNYRDKPWLLEHLWKFSSAGGKRAVIVLGFSAQEYQEAIPWLASAREQWITKEGLEVAVVLNPTPEWGSFSSLVSGGAWLNATKPLSGVFILPVDVPAPSCQVWTEMALGLKRGVDVCMPLWKNRGASRSVVITLFATLTEH
jgi:hypothetical protein